MSDLKYLDKLIDKAHEVIGKKYTTKQRKKMKKSAFCGPGRSFPVTDCLHVRVAKTYLGRAKFSKSTKQRIAACINRKAKALGCGVTKKAKATKERLIYASLSGEEKNIYRSEIFNSTKELVEQSLKSPDMNLFGEEESCEECK